MMTRPAYAGATWETIVGFVRPLACVTGDLDLVRPLGLAGTYCAAVARPGDLARYSRYRERLARAFRFVISEPAVIKDLVDTGRFQALAARLDLPVPPMCHASPMHITRPEYLDLQFPLIVKPLARSLTGGRWKQIAGSKAVQANTAEELRELWRRLAWDDPMPYLRGILWRRLSRLRSGLRPGHLAAGTAAQGADAH